MADQLVSFFAKRFVGDRVGNYFKRDDPYFEATQDTPGGHKSKPKKKGLPPGLSERDARILKKVRGRAYHMDRSINCCCCGGRFGWSAVIGIIPVIGDVIDLLIALSVVRLCMQVELPKHIVAEMYSNMAFDFGIGLIPVVGDLADAWFKCNTRNNILLERFLRDRGAKHPAPPPPPKQSLIRRWFGPGPSAPGSHAVLSSQGDGTTHVPAPTSTTVPTTAASGVVAGSPPELPARKGFNVFGSKNGTHDGATTGADTDLEAQAHGGDIHYSRQE